MRHTRSLALTIGGIALLAACATPGSSSGPMTFFVTSAGMGQGGNLGGLAGADAHCQRLATAAGAGARTWRAYLSTPPTMPSASTPGVAGVHARDRIGKGPWHNAKGQLIARDADHLHGTGSNNISKQTALDERGNLVPGSGDRPNQHDMLTGSREDGTAFSPHVDTTCRAWTHGGPDGSAMVGHHDRVGLNSDNWSKSWNFSHPTPGCSQEALVRVGGAGRFYCFAAN